MIPLHIFSVMEVVCVDGWTSRSVLVIPGGSSVPLLLQKSLAGKFYINPNLAGLVFL